MVYKKKRTYKKRYNKRTYRTNWMGMAKKALTTARWVAGLVNSEFKYDDTSVANQTFDNTGYMSIIAAPSQGDTASDRQGDSIKIKNVTLRGQLYRNATAGDTMARVIVFWDKQNDIANTSQLLSSVGNANVCYSPKNDSYKFNSKIYFDKNYALTADSPLKILDEVIKIDRHTQFVTGTSTPATGAVKIAVFSSQSGANLPALNYYSRVTFVDN